MKTFMAKPQTVESKWYIVDATNMPLGRLASQVATILRGKNKPEYTPHVDTGDHVIVINSDKLVLTGNKLRDKKHYHHTGFVGGLKTVGYDELMKYGTMLNAKENGAIRMEGKEYIVKDGDIILFKFNV